MRTALTKRIVLICLLFFAFFLFKSPAFAQTPAGQSPLGGASPTAVPNQQQQYTAPNVNPDVPQNQHTWIQSIMLESMSSLSCQLTGVDPLSPNQKCLSYDVKTGKIGYANTNGGLLGFTTNMIAALYTAPLHTGDYVRYMAQNFGIAKPTYAATDGGFSFNSLQPLIKLWSVFRNIIYVVFILVFLIIGLAIMFRVKIDPRTVMTLQNQIPKIIIGLILVTFSIAIASLLIDLMYVISFLIVGIFGQVDSSLLDSSKIGINLVSSTNPFNAISQVTTHIDGGGAIGIANVSSAASNAIGQHLGDVFNNDLGHTIFAIFGAMIGILIGGAVGLPFSGLIGGIIGGVVGTVGTEFIATTLISILAFLVIAVAIIASLFRLWFQLILAYVSILIDIIFAPFWIAAGLVPGSKINFSSWLRNLAANLAAFPAVIVMFLLARVFLTEFKSGNANFFVPPLIGDPGSGTEVGALIALGLILATPSVVKLMKTVFGAPQVGFGPVFGGILTGVKIITTGARPVVPRLYSRRYDPVKREYFTSGALARPIGAMQNRFFRAIDPGERIRNRFRNRNLPHQGPVPPNADEGNFRRTGQTGKQGGNNPQGDQNGGEPT